MNSGLKKCKYFKTLNGVTRYGEIHIEISSSVNSSIIVDACTWKTFKKGYSDFRELEILKVWRKSAKSAAESFLKNRTEREHIEIVIRDIVGIYVDTNPCIIGVTTIIGIMNYLGIEISDIRMRKLEQFIIENDSLEKIPAFESLFD